MRRDRPAGGGRPANPQPAARSTGRAAARDPSAGRGDRREPVSDDSQRTPGSGDWQRPTASGDSQGTRASGDRQRGPVDGHRKQGPVHGDRQRRPGSGGREQRPGSGDRGQGPGRGGRRRRAVGGGCRRGRPVRVRCVGRSSGGQTYRAGPSGPAGPETGMVVPPLASGRGRPKIGRAGRRTDGPPDQETRRERRRNRKPGRGDPYRCPERTRWSTGRSGGGAGGGGARYRAEQESQAGGGVEVRVGEGELVHDHTVHVVQQQPAVPFRIG